MPRKGQHLSRGTNRWKTNFYGKQLKEYERQERRRIREEARRERASNSNQRRTSRSRSYGSKAKYSHTIEDDDILGNILLCVICPPIGIIWIGIKIIDFIRSIFK